MNAYPKNVGGGRVCYLDGTKTGLGLRGIIKIVFLKGLAESKYRSCMAYAHMYASPWSGDDSRQSHQIPEHRVLSKVRVVHYK